MCGLDGTWQEGRNTPYGGELDTHMHMSHAHVMWELTPYIYSAQLACPPLALISSCAMLHE